MGEGDPSPSSRLEGSKPSRASKFQPVELGRLETSYRIERVGACCISTRLGGFSYRVPVAQRDPCAMRWAYAA